MKRNLFHLLLIAFALLWTSCDKEVTEDITDDDTQQDESVSELEANGLRVSNEDKINCIFNIEKTDEYTLVTGLMEFKGWFCKCDAQGNEIYSYTLNDIEGYDLSRIDDVTLRADQLLVLTCWYYNADDEAEQTLLLDFETGTLIRPLNDIHLVGPDLQIYLAHSNHRVLIYFSDTTSFLYVLDTTGKLLYKRPTIAESEDDILCEHLLFFTDEIICSTIDGDLNILNLKTWEPICKIDRNQFELTGEHLHEKDVFYQLSDIYVEEDTLFYTYAEYLKTTPTSTAEQHVLLGTYYYKMSTLTYQITGPFKQEPVDTPSNRTQRSSLVLSTPSLH